MTRSVAASTLLLLLAPESLAIVVVVGELALEALARGLGVGA